jgi:hypothetical protein
VLVLVSDIDTSDSELVSVSAASWLERDDGRLDVFEA